MLKRDVERGIDSDYAFNYSLLKGAFNHSHYLQYGIVGKPCLRLQILRYVALYHIFGNFLDGYALERRLNMRSNELGISIERTRLNFTLLLL